MSTDLIRSVLLVLLVVRPAVSWAQDGVPAPNDVGASVQSGPVGEAPPAQRTDSAAFESSMKSAVAAMPRDVWHSVSFESATVGALGLAAAGIAHHWDAASLEEVREVPTFRSAVRPGNTVGSFAVQAGVAVGAFALGRLTQHPRLAQTGLDALRAQVVTQAWVQAVKISVNRQRPDGTRFSFPSGHVATTFATAEVVRRDLGWKAGVPMYALGVYVASARMAQNHHYLSDVLFGAAIGLASAHSLRLGHGAAPLVLTPVVTPGGAGVQFSIAGHR